MRTVLYQKYIKRLAFLLAFAMIFTSVRSVNMIQVKAADPAGITVSKVGGWNETLYMQISGISDSDVTAVSYSGPTTGTLTGEDFEYLVRDLDSGVRIDILGLKPGTYSITVSTSKGDITRSGIVVEEQDRSGYAHFNYTEGVGAYNDDGTLKDNAIVLYVTDANKDSVTVTSRDGTTVTGIGNILNSSGMEATAGTGLTSSGGLANTNQDIIRRLAEDGTPLVVRIIGNVTAPEGLTAYASVDYGGGTDSNGYMARIRNGKDITIEGIGYDAVINGWGIHFVAGSQYLEFGKSFEVRNISFQNVPEDCLGMEGKQSGTTLTNPVERCWIHNCEFIGPNLPDIEQYYGDGACDIKRGRYFTNSYCVYDGYNLTGLVGASDSDIQYHVTYHHNYYKSCVQRAPLARQANIHMYNNIFEGTTNYAMNTRANAYIFSEYNMFYLANNPVRVDSGAVKSFNDSFSGTINKNGATIVNDKNTKVTSGCAYENFDTNAEISYIPFGDYQLQESVTEAKKVIYALSGPQAENPVDVEGVTDEMISLLSDRPTAAVELPYSVSSISVKDKGVVFRVDEAVNISMTDGGTLYKPILLNEFGEEIITGTGTAANVPAGVYFIQTSGFHPADTLDDIVYYEAKVASLSIEACEPGASDSSEESSEPREDAGEDSMESSEPSSEPSEPIVPESKEDHFFDARLLTISADREAMTNDQFTDDYFSVKGNVVKRGSSEVRALEIAKAKGGMIEFTVTGTAEVTLGARSTSSVNTSAIAILNEKSETMANSEGAATVTGSIVTELHYTLPAGTYSVVSPLDNNYSRAAQVIYIDVLETIRESDLESAPSYKNRDLYVSATATSAGDGTYENPMDFRTAINLISEGYTVWMMDGTYKLYEQYGETIVIMEYNSGKEGAYKKVSSIDGGEVIIDFDGMEEDDSNKGIVLDGSYWHFYGIDICNAGSNGMRVSGDYNIVEMCQFYNNHDTGLQISRHYSSNDTIELWPSYNLIKNCTSFNNMDEITNENADGFAAKLTCGEGNVFDGCIAYCNSDDGWDLFAKPETGPIGVVTIKNCVAFGNGKLTDGTLGANMNGFKLGGSGIPTPHIVENCLAFNNGATGFADNNNGDAIKLTNCTSANNGLFAEKSNYSCNRSSSDAVYTNLLSYAANTSVTSDRFNGTLDNVLYYYKGVTANNGYYWVDSHMAPGSSFKYTGLEADDYTVTASNFVSTTVPGYNAEDSTYATNYHEVFRDEDGNIDLNGLYELTETSPLRTAGNDGGILGSTFSKTTSEPVLNGLVYNEADGLWYYYENGQWISDKYDLVEYNGGTFFVANGLVQTGVSGLQLFGENFYYLSGGQLQSQYTGLAEYDGEWFYVENGILAINFNGIQDYDGSKFLIAVGRVLYTYSGLYEATDGTWYYISLGQVQTQYTGLVAYDGAWFYLVEGKLASDYTGTVEYDGAQFEVVNGQVVTA